MPKPKAKQFKKNDEVIAKHWAAAITNNTSWNKFVEDVHDDPTTQKENDAYWSLTGDSRSSAMKKATKWAEDEYSTSTKDVQDRMAQVRFLSDKLLPICTTIKKSHDKKYEKPLPLPEGSDRRYGLSKSSIKKTTHEEFLSFFGAEFQVKKADAST